MATRRETVKYIAAALAGLYDAREAEAIARMVVCERLGVDFTRLVVDYDAECAVAGLDATVAELQSGRPVQYVLGRTQFCGLDFAVCEGVLIPRPETEEMVLRAAAAIPAGSRILDVGTGSGAIAVSLARLVEGARVTAVDISPQALAVAAGNARRNGVEVNFIECDALAGLCGTGRFDAIISNPPYVPQSDRSSMHTNVRDYEPAAALFVPDDDPLLFYRSIAADALEMLNGGGMLWFEIYEKFGPQICRMLREMGFAEVEIVADANMKPRMVCSRKR